MLRARLMLQNRRMVAPIFANSGPAWRNAAVVRRLVRRRVAAG
jgi:hypothetical protein